MVSHDSIDGLVRVGFSEYEAKAYVALLQEHPVTGYQLAKSSGVPRSMVYEVLGKLTARGAAMSLHKQGSTLYAPVPAEELLDRLQHQHAELVALLKGKLSAVQRPSDAGYAWGIEGHENIATKAQQMIAGAQHRVDVSLTPSTLEAFRAALETSARRGVRVVVHTTEQLSVEGGEVVASAAAQRARERVDDLCLVLVVDGREVLIGERLSGNGARAAWSGSPLLVLVAEDHLCAAHCPSIPGVCSDGEGCSGRGGPGGRAHGSPMA